MVRATTELKRALRVFHDIASNSLPEALKTVGTRKFEIDGGLSVALNEKLDGRKLVDPVGLEYVEANGGAALISCVVTVELDAGDLDVACELVTLLRAHRASNRFKTLSLDRSVHQSTIASFARELRAAGKNPPLDLLGVTERSYATVGKAPKTVNLKGFDE